MFTSTLIKIAVVLIVVAGLGVTVYFSIHEILKFQQNAVTQARADGQDLSANRISAAVAQTKLEDITRQLNEEKTREAKLNLDLDAARKPVNKLKEIITKHPEFNTLLLERPTQIIVKINGSSDKVFKQLNDINQKLRPPAIGVK